MIPYIIGGLAVGAFILLLYAKVQKALKDRYKAQYRQQKAYKEEAIKVDKAKDTLKDRLDEIKKVNPDIDLVDELNSL